MTKQRKHFFQLFCLHANIMKEGNKNKNNGVLRAFGQVAQILNSLSVLWYLQS